MQIVALDLSLTGTGVVHNGGARTITTKLKDEARIAYIVDQAGRIGSDLVIVEGLAFGTQTGKAMERAGLWWAIKMAYWYSKVPVAICPPTCIKKYITGKGNAGKDEVMIAAVKQLPMIEITNNNEADAAVMYAMARERIGRPLITVPKINSAVLDKVAWPDGF